MVRLKTSFCSSLAKKMSMVSVLGSVSWLSTVSWMSTVSQLSTVSPGEWGKMRCGWGGRCLRKESPTARQELAGRLLAAALNVSPKREFYNTENSRSHKGFGDFGEFHHKTASQTQGLSGQPAIQAGGPGFPRAQRSHPRLSLTSSQPWRSCNG